MESTEVKQEQEELVVDEHRFGASIGTWVSLGIVGAVIFATFILLFSIYFARI